MKFLKRYRFFIGTLFLMLIIWMFNRELGMNAIDTTVFSFKEMLLVIPPVFVLLGLLDIWIPKDTMIKYMGDDSGIIGVILSFLLGSAAAGPLYGAFPVAAVFMKKGVRFRNVLIFIGAWSTTKIPLFLFELSSLGPEFALTRLFINIPGIIILSMVLEKAITKEEKGNIYKLSENMT
ncbi:putative permease [Natranaerovirga hydrolytica]|uniref:Putative permease n=1 Tax=Natranaerovirga hydrolytica TaxID=680378 RepID=A0A4R1N025_9FIRM|nr:permease [Natranaerovirga hydrolytica]TCK98815.1 putative permease [Natranaerovirga hydrolytica]